MSGIAARRQAARKEGSEAYDKRRSEIIKAATDVFNRRGFRGTSLGAVAEELAIDRASLYYYVGSKSELFDEVIREVSVVNIETAERIRKEDAPAPEKLERLICALMDSYAQYYPLLYVYIREDISQVGDERSTWASAMRKLNSRYDKAVIGIVQEGIDAGTIRATGPAWLIAFGVIGMVNWTSRWFDPASKRVTAGEVGAAFASMIVEGLKA